MVEELEQIVRFLQEHEKVRVGLLTAATFAGGAYLLHIYRKHINPIVAGLLVYPLRRKYDKTPLMEFLRREYRQNLEELGYKPTQSVTTPKV